MFKVEKNVPLKKGQSGQPQLYPFDSMEIGDSFEVGEHTRSKANSIYGSIYHYIGKKANKKKKFALRNVEGKLRIWRKK